MYMYARVRLYVYVDACIYRKDDNDPRFEFINILMAHYGHFHKSRLLQL